MKTKAGMWLKTSSSNTEGSTVKTSLPPSSDAQFPRLSPRRSFSRVPRFSHTPAEMFCVFPVFVPAVTLLGYLCCSVTCLFIFGLLNCLELVTEFECMYLQYAF